MSHTPGPWIVVEEAAIDYRPQQILGRGGDSRVAVCLGGGPKFAVGKAEERANARLIAASPDLLAAVEALLEYEAYDGDDPDHSDPLYYKAVRLARDAKTKVTGGQP